MPSAAPPMPKARRVKRLGLPAEAVVIRAFLDWI
jgi:hypothetical protein